MERISSGIFSPRRVAHINVVVENLPRSVDFYSSVCGLKLEFSETGITAGFMGTGNTHHDVGMMERSQSDRYGKDGHLQVPKAAGARVTLNHIAWEVDNERELVQSYRRAVAAGVVIDRAADHEISHSLYMKDPDGNVAEFYADMIEDWREVLHGEMNHITSRWAPDEASALREPRWLALPQPRRVEGAALLPGRLAHVVLGTRDAGRLAAFYEQVGGLAVVHRHDGLVMLRGSNAVDGYHLAIVEAAQPGLHHTAFELQGGQTLGDATASLRRRGIEPDAVIDGPVKRSLYITDPDGFRLEFFERKSDDYGALAETDPAALPFLV